LSSKHFQNTNLPLPHLKSKKYVKYGLLFRSFKQWLNYSEVGVGTLHWPKLLTVLHQNQSDED